jgi:hypothetical protein
MPRHSPKELCEIDGKLLGLHDIEQGIIRPGFQDPGIHFAVNCASQSCPPLLLVWTCLEPPENPSTGNQVFGAPNPWRCFQLRQFKAVIISWQVLPVAWPRCNIVGPLKSSLELKLHTDEYEISVGREINHCRKRVDKLTKALQEREKHYGMTTEEFLSAHREGQLTKDNQDFEKWKEDAKELESWSRHLKGYEEAYRMLKNI